MPFHWAYSTFPAGPKSMDKRTLAGRLAKFLLMITPVMCLTSQVFALPSFARQTGQRCAACHVGGNWPQLTPWGRFFKLAGYTAGRTFAGKEGFNYVPLGILGQLGLNWAAQPNDSQGNPVVTQNGAPEAYGFTGEVGTKIADFAGIFYEYGIGNTFPGWKGAAGPWIFARFISFTQAIVSF